MLKIENIEVTGWEAAIRGMRNPMNSWEKSDTKLVPDGEVCTWTINNPYFEREAPEIGSNDLDLMRRLAKGGATHAKYRRMINVTMDITAPLYWWKEFDTYKVGTVANSCSTMHKIQAKEFTRDDFSCERLFPAAKEQLKSTIDLLNYYRDIYVNGKEPTETELGVEPGVKTFWWQMIQLLPSSYNQRRTVQFNYEVLSHIYFDRRNHKLDCWHTFCDMIEQLPYAEDIIIVGSKDAESDSEDALKKENEEFKKKIEFLEGFIHSYTPGLKGL